MEEYKGFWKLIAYSVGMAGWSILMNTIWVMLIYFYLPPQNSGMPVLVPQIVFFGILTTFSLILASGRLVDAVTDPVIAWISDKSRSRWGRRIPFMAIAVVPSIVFSTLLFLPPENYESAFNYRWLFYMQIGFYFSITLYIVPYNALMPELAKTKDSQLLFSTVLSVMFVIGIIIASQIPWFASTIKLAYPDFSYQRSYFNAILTTNALAFIFMLIPVIFVQERKYCKPKPVTSSPFRSIYFTFKNKNFVTFLFADASFFLTLALVSTGIIYYVKVLTGLPDPFASRIMGLMVLLSLLLYPVVVALVKKFGKKRIIIISFFLFSLILLYISFLGKLPFSAEIQLYLICIAGAFPFAVLGILPYAITAEIAEADGRITGEQREGMYFAVRAFTGKIGQTLGVMIFTIFTVFGKDEGDDLGLRISAVAGGLITLFAAIWFFRYRE